MRVPAEERRLVTVLFADMVGSTALAESMDPEDVRALMSRYYDHARQVVHSYGGTLEKFIGDAVVAVFGVPLALGDDAQRAVACAHSLKQAITDDPQLGRQIQLRFGLDTGHVVAVSTDALQNFLASGDVMNTAARIQQHAESGEILVSDRTMSAVDRHYRSGSTRFIEARGKREPVAVHAVDAIEGNGEAAAVPEFVGRETEIKCFSVLWTRAASNGRCQLVTVVGTAGIGKTRLVQQAFAPDFDAVAWISFRPFGHTSLQEWLPRLRAMLLAADDHVDGATSVFVRGGYGGIAARSLAEHIFGLDESRAAGPRGSVARDHHLGAWRSLVECASRVRPRVLVFDNLNAADSGSRDLVRFISMTRSEVPLLVVLIARPELLDAQPPWDPSFRDHLRLETPPLGRDASVQLIRACDPGLSDDAAARIASLGGGNPCFLQELVQARRAAGPQSAAEDLPPNVYSAILARADRLSAPAKELAQVLSVAGTDVPNHHYWRLLPELQPVVVRRALTELQEAGFIEVGGGRPYAFVHGLVQDVVYDSLTRGLKVRLHVAAAQLIRELMSVGDVVAAGHFHKAISIANRAIVPDYSSIPVEEACASLRTGAEFEVASGLKGSLTRATDYLETGLLMDDALTRTDLLETLGDVLGWSAAGLERYREALESSAEAHLCPLTELRLLRKLLILAARGGMLLIGATDTATIRRWLERALLLHPDVGDEYESARLDSVFLFLDDALRERYRELGEADDVEEVIRRVLGRIPWFLQRGDVLAASEALDGCQFSVARTGDLDRALAINRRRGDIDGLPPREVADSVTMSADCLWRSGRAREAIDTVRSARARVSAGASLAPFAGPLVLAVNIAFETGDWDIVPGFASDLTRILGDAMDIGGAETSVQNSDIVSCLGALFTIFRIAITRADQARAEELRRLIKSCPMSEGGRLVLDVLLDLEGGLLPVADKRAAMALDGNPGLLLRILLDREADAPELVAACCERLPEQDVYRRIALARVHEDAEERASALADAASGRLNLFRARMLALGPESAAGADERRKAIAFLESIGDLRTLALATRADH